MVRKKKKERDFPLSIYLIKAGVTDHGKIVPSRTTLEASAVKHGRKTLGTLYVKYITKRDPASWTAFLRGGVEDDFLDKLKPRSVSAVFLVEQDDRIFALTFGYGHNLVDPEHVVSDFGLKTTLNAADPEAIRQVDRRKLDSTGRIAIEQAGVAIPISQFGLNIEQDLVRRVTAKPRDPQLASMLSGKEALRAMVPVNLGNLNELLSTFLRISQEKTYQDNFAFIDNIYEVREEERILELQTEVVRLANDDAAPNVFMAPPDIVDLNTTQGLRYTEDSDEEPRPDIDLVSFQAVALGGDPITWAALENHRIYVVNDQDAVSTSWAAYKCLYAEFEYQGHVYVITEGKWYEIKNDFATRVKQNFANIPDSELELPRWTQKNEGEYNESAANGSEGYLRLMDRKNILFPTRRDKIEFCDLLSVDKHLVHVKHFASSSGMSHLCMQATNSAEYLKMEREFRELVNAEQVKLGIPAEFHVPLDFTQVHAAQYEVVFAIAGKHAHLPIEIPFFSKVSIHNAARRCEGLGFKVSKLKVVRDALAD